VVERNNDNSAQRILFLAFNRILAVALNRIPVRLEASIIGIRGGNLN
jgi:hypothetical protein